MLIIGTAQRTGHECSSSPEGEEPERIDEVPDDPMPTVRAELIVYDGESRKRDAGVQSLHAVPCRPGPADEHEQPT